MSLFTTELCRTFNKWVCIAKVEQGRWKSNSSAKTEKGFDLCFWRTAQTQGKATARNIIGSWPKWIYKHLFENVEKREFAPEDGNNTKPNPLLVITKMKMCAVFFSLEDQKKKKDWDFW